MHGSTSGLEVQKTGPLQSTSAVGVMSQASTFEPRIPLPKLGFILRICIAMTPEYDTGTATATAANNNDDNDNNNTSASNHSDNRNITNTNNNTKR